jgi:hypothetical protein
MLVHDLIENHDGSIRIQMLIDIIKHEILVILFFLILSLIEMLDVQHCIGMLNQKWIVSLWNDNEM